MANISDELIRSLLKNKNNILVPTQTKISLPIVNRLVNKMEIGLTFTGISIVENYIIDGHHRFIASIVSNTHLEFIQGTKPSEINIYEWNDIIFEELDWDSTYKVKEFDKQDAQFNNLTLEELLIKLKK